MADGWLCEHERKEKVGERDSQCNKDAEWENRGSE